MRIDRALVDAAVWSRSARKACALLAAGVQQRLTTATRLRAELVAPAECATADSCSPSSVTIEGGAHSLAEIGFARLCRRGGLPQPVRQVVRLDRWGRRRYLDVTWQLPDGRTIVVEVDGALHLLALTYWDDMDRAIELLITGAQVVRIPTVALRLDPNRVLDQLRRLLAPAPVLQNARYSPRSA